MVGGGGADAMVGGCSIGGGGANVVVRGGSIDRGGADVVVGSVDVVDARAASCKATII